jgi:DNA-directed RNA polymerase subunit RPC12/RpoP
MPNDDEQNQRFAMIAREMRGDFEPSAPEPEPERDEPFARGMNNCPRCGLRALERLTYGSGMMAGEVACLACPPPAPVYGYPAGLVLVTNGYRCARCGNTPQVTMTISEANLHCRNCSQLTLHVKQPEKPASTFPGYASKTRANIRFQFERTALAVAKSRVFTDEIYDVRLANDPVLVELTRSMISILGLEDFDRYAERKRRENRDNEVKNTSRQTGRTMRGIVELLARHYFSTATVVWTLGGTSYMSLWLRNEVRDVCNQLGRVSTVIEVPPTSLMNLEQNQLKPPPGVMLLVDHTYFEQR